MQLSLDVFQIAGSDDLHLQFDHGIMQRIAGGICGISGEFPGAAFECAVPFEYQNIVAGCRDYDGVDFERQSGENSGAEGGIGTGTEPDFRSVFSGCGHAGHTGSIFPMASDSPVCDG